MTTGTPPIVATGPGKVIRAREDDDIYTMVVLLKDEEVERIARRVVEMLKKPTGIALYVYPDGRMLVQTGDVELSASGRANLISAVEEAQHRFKTGQPFIFHGDVRFVGQEHA